MKRFYLAEVFVIVALVIGFFLGKSTNSFDKHLRNYYQDAQAAYEEAQKANNPPVTWEESNRMSKVLALYRKVFELYPDSQWADDALFTVASQLAPTDEEAIPLYRRLVREHFDSQWVDDAIYSIGMGYYSSAAQTGSESQYNYALREFNRLIDEFPDSQLVDESYFNRAMCYYGKAGFKRALEEFAQFEERFADSPQIYGLIFYRGMIFLQQGQYEAARIQFLNAVDSADPTFAPQAQFQMGEAHFQEGSYEQAIEAYRQTIEHFPASVWAENAQFYIGWALQKLEKHEESIAQLEEAIRNYPNNENAAFAQVFIGNIYAFMEDVDNAADAYRKVADDRTNDYDMRRSAQYLVGKLYEDSGELAKAVAEYETLISEFPEYHSKPRHPSNDIDGAKIQVLKTKLTGGAEGS